MSLFCGFVDEAFGWGLIAKKRLELWMLIKKEKSTCELFKVKVLEFEFGIL